MLCVNEVCKIDFGEHVTGKCICQSSLRSSTDDVIWLYIISDYICSLFVYDDIILIIHNRFMKIYEHMMNVYDVSTCLAWLTYREPSRNCMKLLGQLCVFLCWAMYEVPDVKIVGIATLTRGINELQNNTIGYGLEFIIIQEPDLQIAVQQRISAPKNR